MNTKRNLPIRASEMGVLILIQKKDRPMMPIEISEFFKITKPSVTSIVNSLVKKEYLMKTNSTIDKRSYSLSLTKKGHTLVAETFKEYFKTVELLQNKMGKHNFEQLIEMISLANKILEEVNE
jgi:DNA-binding MarR family transcriptional regulator